MNQHRLDAPGPCSRGEQGFDLTRLGEAGEQPLRFAVALVRLPGLAGSGEGSSQVLRELVEDVNHGGLRRGGNHGGMLPRVALSVDGQGREVCS